MNYYKALGVAQNADADAIQSAYDAMVQKYHPDINPDGGEKFKQINKAYETLRDPKKRREYNATLSGGAASGASGGAKPTSSPGGAGRPANGAGRTASGANSSAGSAMTGGLGDILDNIRSQGQRNAQASRAAPAAGSAPTVEIALTMSEVMHGTVKPIIVNGKKINVRIRVEG